MSPPWLERALNATYLVDAQQRKEVMPLSLDSASPDCQIFELIILSVHC